MTTEWTAGGRPELDVEAGYRLWAQGYDVESNALIILEEPEVDRLLAAVTFDDVLDAGTGTGRHALRLARRGARITAFDASPEMLALARAKAAAEGLSLRFQEARIDGPLPFADASFDLVTCGLVLCHIADLTPVVSEFARVLRPGGHLLITDFHPEMVAAGARTTFAHDGRKYVITNPALSVESYREAVASAGLSLKDVIEIPLLAAPVETMSDAFINTFRDKQLCLIVFAQKPAAG